VRYPPLIEGRLVRRYKRFLADVEVGGEVVTAHCANPGRMTTCAEVGGAVWLSESSDPRRKLGYRWELAEIGGELLSVNTARSNQVVEEALLAGSLPAFAGHGELRREVAVGGSRIDFALDLGGGGRCLIEVKTVTLAVGDGVCAFPDSVTARGRRHLETLIAARARGDRAALLFLCARAGARSIRPADDIDPAYGETLRRAAAAGVEIHGRGCAISLAEIRLGERLPVALQ
jgi:sugar fermentation stimulation protein A